MRMLSSLLMFLVMVTGCKPRAATPPALDSGPPTSIVNRDWTLAQLGENNNPVGNGGAPVTLRLDSTEHRAGGNAGCNHYSGPYTLAGNQLTFGPAISTKMACEQGMNVETAFLGMLANVTSYRATDSSLTFMGPAGELARFR